MTFSNHPPPSLWNASGRGWDDIFAGDLLGVSSSTVPPPAAYTYAPNGNLLSKPGLSNVVYGGPRPHAVTSAKVKGVTRSFAYNDAGYVTSDGRRSYTWTSFGQLSSLDYPSAPALQNFAGIEIYAASQVQCNFDFDAAGSRARQIKQRIAADQSRQLEETLYLGSYERELHMSKASASASPVVTKTVHRHSLGGFAVYTKTEGSTGSNLKLSTLLKDHLGSTDLILTGQWNGSAFVIDEPPDTERQSFDSWGERRAADTFVTYRATDSDAFRTSAHDYDRGYTGHEQLDDSGLIHMNGRIYDPELGRMLSPDPVVQVPEYSQNFNRYSYVMNNPLNMIDPTGFSWVSKVFHQVGSWLKENWRTVVIAVVALVVGAVSGGLASAWAVGLGLGPAASAAIGAGVGTFWGSFTGAVLGGVRPVDALKGAFVNALQAAALTYVAAVGLEQMVNWTNVDQEAKLYKVDGRTGEATPVPIDSIPDGTLRGEVFENGIRNDKNIALFNGSVRASPGKDYYLIHNPTNGALGDLLESTLDKVAGQSNISRGTARILAKFDMPNTTILAHSQGTLITTNALNIMASQQDISGVKLYSWGAAQNELGSHLVLGGHGVNVGNHANHPLDAVANIVGFNAVTKPNPYRIAASLVASPLLFADRPFSPHSLPEGGAYLKWFPWLYDKQITR